MSSHIYSKLFSSRYSEHRRLKQTTDEERSHAYEHINSINSYMNRCLPGKISFSKHKLVSNTFRKKDMVVQSLHLVSREREKDVKVFIVIFSLTRHADESTQKQSSLCVSFVNEKEKMGNDVLVVAHGDSPFNIACQN